MTAQATDTTCQADYTAEVLSHVPSEVLQGLARQHCCPFSHCCRWDMLSQTLLSHYAFLPIQQPSSGVAALSAPLTVTDSISILRRKRRKRSLSWRAGKALSYCCCNLHSTVACVASNGVCILWRVLVALPSVRCVFD